MKEHNKSQNKKEINSGRKKNQQDTQKTDTIHEGQIKENIKNQNKKEIKIQVKKTTKKTNVKKKQYSRDK